MTSLNRYSHRRLGRAGVRGRRRWALKETYPAIADAVPVARRRIVGFAVASGVDSDQVEAIRLASSEALSNVVEHAYPDRPGRIDVAAWVVHGELWVLIADDGCGLHAGGDSEGLGLGLALISQVSDGFVVMERGSGGTEVRMRFEIGVGEGADEQPIGRVHYLR